MRESGFGLMKTSEENFLEKNKKWKGKNMNNGSYIRSKIKEPCCVCGKLTNRIEYNYEAYICSRECEKVMDKKLIESEKCDD